MSARNKASKKKVTQKKERTDRKTTYIVGFTFLWIVVIYLIGWSDVLGTRYSREEVEATTTSTSSTPKQEAPKPVLDIKAYDAKMIAMANYASTTASTTKRIWPTNDPYPKAGAILPFKRIIAYYGNFYSTKMGVLGEYPVPEMLAKLKATSASWEAADPSTPVVPAIDYIALTAQGSPGKQGYYMLRMPDSQIDIAVDLAKQVNGIVILDVQVGLSTLQRELPMLDKYLAMPNVHLAIDPEFSMKNGEKPGTVIGTFSSADVNYAAQHLAKLVQENNLPPKVLIIHRFTENMVTGYQNINPLPEVQIVMDMDGWGDPAKKLNTYQRFEATQPVQFTGFKLFYKNDLKPPSTRLLTPKELLKLTPRPMFIQYQ
ncbi:lipoprotein [soil metagenome]